MSSTTVPPISSPAEPEPSAEQATLELDLRLRHPQQQLPVGTSYMAASATTHKSRVRRPAKPPPHKKQPQRGLGVAQLEQLRLQERWKKLIEIPGQQQQQHPSQMTTPLGADPQVVPLIRNLQAEVAGGGTRRPPPPSPPFQYPVVDSAGGVLPQYETGGRFLPSGVFGMGRGFVMCKPLSGGLDGVNNGASRELSSMPNTQALVPDYSDHNIYLTAGMNGKVKPVVGGVVLEYEFFPGKRCRNTWNEEQCLPTLGVGGGGGGGASDTTASEASNSIDLSLKL